MVNTEQFGIRLNKILEFYDLSAASFADKIEVGRSSISHILSGRNKPSLDFVMKIVKTFPEVELYWLLNGKGKFPKEDKQEPVSSSAEKNNPAPTGESIPEQQTAKLNEVASAPSTIMSSKSKPIKKIVIFYEDGTFDAFEN
ncbi:helix-turn-helix domain-containing protein [Zunongwangia sp. F363]|uniref:Helix-turn-helix domain-containing protein n=1 Tax=Autumnicola tepida TaxID=3075595 RepID=A0ABU3CCP8_9FLAO|nr:helix-turn-helix domain-containing protein [Zunongwangia sp. F363]MDT0644086.1 helix-turn-helix domain-containing protein [Zunongwangia sp. F363]